MNYSKLSKEELLFQGGVCINNSLSDSKVLSAVSPMGYTVAKLNEGAVVLSDAGTLYDNQKKEYGEMDAAQVASDTERKACNRTYMDLVRICRIALKNDVKAATTLDLNGRRSRTISGWQKQTLGFYRAILANDEWKTVLAVYGQTEEILTAQLAAIENVAIAAETVKKEMGDAQDATQQRDLKFEELIDWLSDYEVIARIALADKPQLLEKIGIVVKG